MYAPVSRFTFRKILPPPPDFAYDIFWAAAEKAELWRYATGRTAFVAAGVMICDDIRAYSISVAAMGWLHRIFTMLALNVNWRKTGFSAYLRRNQPKRMLPEDIGNDIIWRQKRSLYSLFEMLSAAHYRL